MAKQMKREDMAVEIGEVHAVGEQQREAARRTIAAAAIRRPDLAGDTVEEKGAWTKEILLALGLHPSQSEIHPHNAAVLIPPMNSWSQR